jgi:hypothetical protein
MDDNRSGSYLVFQEPDYKYILNDSGDSVRLIDPNGESKSFVTTIRQREGEVIHGFLILEMDKFS